MIMIRWQNRLKSMMVAFVYNQNTEVFALGSACPAQETDSLLSGTSFIFFLLVSTSVDKQAKPRWIVYGYESQRSANVTSNEVFPIGTI